MRLAKPFIDVGVQTNERESMLSFWGQTVGLSFEELLKSVAVRISFDITAMARCLN